MDNECKRNSSKARNIAPISEKHVGEKITIGISELPHRLNIFRKSIRELSGKYNRQEEVHVTA